MTGHRSHSLRYCRCWEVARCEAKSVCWRREGSMLSKAPNLSAGARRFEIRSRRPSLEGRARRSRTRRRSQSSPSGTAERARRGPGPARRRASRTYSTPTCSTSSRGSPTTRTRRCAAWSCRHCSTPTDRALRTGSIRSATNNRAGPLLQFHVATPVNQAAGSDSCRRGL
jgi:hypothetical protein